MLYTTDMDSPINRWQIHNVSGDNRMATIRGLKPNAAYTVCVLAYSTYGQGPMSDPKKIVVKSGRRYFLNSFRSFKGFIDCMARGVK